MSLKDELAADTQDAVAGYEETFEWRGVNYPCVRSRPAGKFILEDRGGYIDGASGSLVVAKTALPLTQWPEQGDLIDHGRFQITNIDGAKKKSSPQLILHFDSPDGGGK